MERIAYGSTPAVCFSAFVVQYIYISMIDFFSWKKVISNYADDTDVEN